MADNPYTVQVVNPLQALLLGEQAYDKGIKANKERAVESARSEATQLAGAGDYRSAIGRLLGAGDYQGVSALTGIDNNQWTRTHTEGRDKVSDAHQKFMENIALRTANRADDRTPSGFAADPNNRGGYIPIPGGPQDPAYQAKVAAETARAKGDVPTIIGSGSSVIVPNKASEGALFTNKPVTDAALDDDTIKAMAEQARAGDISVFQNLGRGAQGAENIVKLRKEIVRQNTEGGVSGAEQALRNAEMGGVKAGQRTIGTKGANIEMAATEFNQVIPVVQAASQAVPRTSYPDLNKIILAGRTRTGDPNVVKLGGGVNTLINLYARAISPSGTPTVSDKEHAREILAASWSSGQFDAAVGMMQQEIKAALESPEKVRDEMRQRFLRGQGAAPVGYPAPGAAKPTVIDGYKITEH